MRAISTAGTHKRTLASGAAGLIQRKQCTAAATQYTRLPPPRVYHPRGSYILSSLLSLKVAAPENKQLRSELSTVCKNVCTT